MHANTSTQTIRRFPLALTAFAVLLATVEPAVAAAQATKGDPRDTTHAQKQAPFFTAKDAVPPTPAATLVGLPMTTGGAITTTENVTVAGLATVPKFVTTNRYTELSLVCRLFKVNEAFVVIRIWLVNGTEPLRH